MGGGRGSRLHNRPARGRRKIWHTLSQKSATVAVFSPFSATVCTELLSDVFVAQVYWEAVPNTWRSLPLLALSASWTPPPTGVRAGVRRSWPFPSWLWSKRLPNVRRKFLSMQFWSYLTQIRSVSNFDCYIDFRLSISDTLICMGGFFWDRYGRKNLPLYSDATSVTVVWFFECFNFSFYQVCLLYFLKLFV